MYSNTILDLLTEFYGTTEHITEQRLMKLQCVYIPCNDKNETIIMRYKSVIIPPVQCWTGQIYPALINDGLLHVHYKYQ